MKHLSRVILPVFMIFSSFCVAEAQKVEVEKRVSETSFPELALEYLQKQYPNAGRIKYYQEFAVDTMTYEAKFRWQKFWYSVKFYPDGSLLDVEKRVKYHTLPKAVQEKIEDKWLKDFKKFKVVKCQEQTSNAGFRYEFEVKGKKQGKTAFYEYLFEADGAFVKRSKIFLRPYDVTLY